MPVALLVTHGVLLIAAGATVLGLGVSRTTEAVLLTVTLVPLVVALPGIAARRRRTCQWLSVALVVYVGAACVEVIASRALAPSLMLLAALMELGLLISSIRRAPP